MAALRDHVDELIGQTRRFATVARLVGPRSTFPVITEIETELAPIYQILADIDTPDQGATLVAPARRLMKLRDNIINDLRLDTGLT
jgi:hypothetical protein